MNLIAIAVIVFVLYLMVRAFGALLAKITGARYRAYRSLAQRFRGRYESRGHVDPPTVSFWHNGSHVRVGLAPVVSGQTSKPRTRVVARFPEGLPLRLELFPASRPSPKQPARGTRPIQVGVPRFDQDYVVRANDEAIASEVLQSQPVQQSIERLRHLCLPSGMVLSVTPERLLVQIDRDLGREADDLVTAVNGTLIIHDHFRSVLKRRLAEGVSIVEAGGPALDDDEAGPPVCKVCNEPIGDSEPRVLCSTCKTPHHRDCWGFVGSCSIYGCQGKHCVSV